MKKPEEIMKADIKREEIAKEAADRAWYLYAPNRLPSWGRVMGEDEAVKMAVSAALYALERAQSESQETPTPEICSLCRQPFNDKCRKGECEPQEGVPAAECENPHCDSGRVETADPRTGELVEVDCGICAPSQPQEAGREWHITAEQVDSVWGVHSQASGKTWVLDLQMINAIIAAALATKEREIAKQRHDFKNFHRLNKDMWGELLAARKERAE